MWQLQYTDLEAIRNLSGRPGWELKYKPPRVWDEAQSVGVGWQPELWAADRIISCWGWRFDSSVFTTANSSQQISIRFHKGSVPLSWFDYDAQRQTMAGVPARGYPEETFPVLTNGWSEAEGNKGLYFAGGMGIGLCALGCVHWLVCIGLCG